MNDKYQTFRGLEKVDGGKEYQISMASGRTVRKGAVKKLTCDGVGQGAVASTSKRPR